MLDPERLPALCHAGLRGQLIRDHERLVKLFEELRAAFDADAREDAARLWADLDRGLSTHMDFEERHLLPAFRAVDSSEVESLLREHDLIRRRLTELGIGVDLHAVRAEIVADFIALLRAHAQREDDLLYRWAERELPPSAQSAFRPAIGGEAITAAQPAVCGRG
jgi:hemerythrin-like domain-containing protein